VHEADSKHTSDHEDEGVDDVPDTPIEDHKEERSIREQKDVAALPLSTDTPGIATNGIHRDESTEPAAGKNDKQIVDSQDDTGFRLAAAAKERDELREQVVELRKSLQTLQQQHEDEVARFERETNEQSQKTRSSTSETEERLAAATLETEEYKERVIKLEDVAKKAQGEREEQLARTTKQEEERQAQQKVASDQERRLIESNREREELKEQVDSLRKSFKNSEQRWEGETAASAKQAEERVLHIKSLADKDEQLKAAAREKEDIQSQLISLKQSLESTRQQRSEEAARLVKENEEYVVQLKTTEQQMAALSQAEQDKELFRKQLVEAQNSLEIIRQQHLDEVEKLKLQNISQANHGVLIAEVEAKLAGAEQARDELQAQVLKLTEGQGDSQQSHEEELRNLRAELEESQTAKDHAQSQHKALLSKVNTIRAQLGERLKADAVGISSIICRIRTDISTGGPQNITSSHRRARRA
jgi:hypothetical protein